jgi:hypothetical protein
VDRTSRGVELIIFRNGYRLGKRVIMNHCWRFQTLRDGMLSAWGFRILLFRLVSILRLGRVILRNFGRCGLGVFV